MIARKSLLVLISTVIIALIGCFEFIIIVKLWGRFSPTALGMIGFAASLLAIFDIVAELGFRRAHIKRVSEGKDLATCIGTFAFVKIILTILMTILVVVTVFILKIVTHGEFFKATSEQIIYILLIGSIFSSIVSIAISTFTARKEIAKREFPFIVARIIAMPFVILVATAGVSSENISPAFVWPDFLQPLQHFIANNAVGALAATSVISSIVAFFIGIWLFRKYPFKRFDRRMFKSYFSFAMPIMLIPIIGTISTSTDKLMIGYFWSSFEVGYYVTMNAVVGLLTIFSISLTTVLFPTISELSSHKNFEKIKQKTLLAERYISMIVIPFIIGLIVLANHFVRIVLTDVYLPAIPILIFLAIFILLICVNSPYRTVISGMDKPSILAKIAALVCLSNIALNFLFIPKDSFLSIYGINGPTGAALATIISTAVGFSLVRIAAKKLIGIRIFSGYSLRQVIAGLVMGAVLYFFAYVAPFFKQIYWYNFLILIMLGTVVYFGMLVLLREFKRQDYNFFRDILRPKEMIKYVSSELKGKPEKPN